MADGIIRLDEGWRLDAGHHFDQPPNVPPPVSPPVPKRIKKKGNTIMADFIPPKRANRRQWLANLSDKVAAEAAKMGVAAGDATAAKTAADGIIATYDATDAAQTALDGKREIEAQTEAANLAQLRALIRNWKTLPNYPSSGSEGVLQLKGTGSAFDPATYKPVIDVSLKGGGITIDFQKKGVDALGIYCRLRGTLAWTKLAVDTISPYADNKPLANPNTPEVREYMARGIIDDVEIGLDSDIVSITYGG